MTLVVANGDLVELRRDLNRDRFAGSVIALGALGIVTQLTLDIEPRTRSRSRSTSALPSMNYRTGSMTCSARVTA